MFKRDYIKTEIKSQTHDTIERRKTKKIVYMMCSSKPFHNHNFISFNLTSSCA